MIRLDNENCNRECDCGENMKNFQYIGNVILGLEAISKSSIIKIDTHQLEESEILKRRCDQKRRREEDDKEAIECEVVRPSLGRDRLRRKFSCGNEIFPQQGMMDTHTFQCCFENLWKSLSDEKRASFAYLDCLWFSLYLKTYSKEKVLEWIKKKQIFSKKYVIVPIVQWRHWSLLILCHMGGDLLSKTSTPCILLLDSLRKTNPKRLEPGIRKFILDLYKTEERPENRKQIYRIPFEVPKVPQQGNGEECGNFVLYYINLFIQSAPESFSISDGYPFFMKKDWFTREDLEGFCGRLISS